MASNGPAVRFSQVLEVFESPISEAQAWGILHQTCQQLSIVKDSITRLEASLLLLHPDGTISFVSTFVHAATVTDESVLLEQLGLCVVSALNHRLPSNFDLNISGKCESLLERMVTSSSGEESDEGIGGEVSSAPDAVATITQVINACLEYDPDPQIHRAVVRALVSEARELAAFLQVVQSEARLSHVDWGRMWLMVMADLRAGVKLRKVEPLSRSIEYSLTPFEMLLDEIRLRRFSLNHVEQPLSYEARRDAQSLILDFIRGRPPLTPLRNSKHGPTLEPNTEKTPREALLEDIMNTPIASLKPTAEETATARKMLEVPMDELWEFDNSFEDDKLSEPATPQHDVDPNKKILECDADLFDLSPTESVMSDLDEESKENLAGLRASFRRKRGLRKRAQSAGRIADMKKEVSSEWLQQLTSSNSNSTLGASSGASTPTEATSSNLVPRVELSLSELQHIRRVLTKMDVETLNVVPQLQADVANGKVCFTCRRVYFKLFGPWSKECELCQQHCCSNCISPLAVPLERLTAVPVSVLGPEKRTVAKPIIDTGSLPSSPGPKEGLEDYSCLTGRQMLLCSDCRALVIKLIHSSRGP